MPWGRAILAVVVTLFVIGGMGSIVALGSGAWRPDFSNAPGLNAEDLAALAAPYDDIRSGRDDAVIARIGGEAEGAQAEIDRIQTLLPPGEPTASRLTSMRAQIGTSGNRLWGVREYEYPDQIVRAETTLYRDNAEQPWSIEGFHVNVLSRQELAARGLNFFSGPPAVQGVIAAAVILPLFMLATFLAALFQPGLKPRWVWLVLAPLGFGTLSANTASDALTFVPLSIQFFGAGATWSGSMFDGWIFSAATPFGAIAYWLSRVFSRAA